jgi:hypothetical protein
MKSGWFARKVAKCYRSSHSCNNKKLRPLQYLHHQYLLLGSRRVTKLNERGKSVGNRVFRSQCGTTVFLVYGRVFHT